MNTLVKYTDEGRVNMSRTIDQFVFEYKVNRKSDFSTCWSDFLLYVVKRNHGRYNKAWFTNDKLMDNLREVWNKFVSQEKERLSKTLKGEDMLEIVMNLFKENKKNKIFISQTACASVLDTNQMAISRELQQMVRNGILILVDRGSNISRKCSTYILGSEGLRIFNKLYEAVMDTIKTVLSEKDQLMLSLKTMATNMKKRTDSFLVIPYTDANRKVDEALEWKKFFEGDTR